MLRVLVTGENSFIGAAFRQRAECFPGAYSITELSLRGDAWRAADFSLYDCVLHVAGIAHVKYNDSMRETYMRVNRDLAVAAARKAKAEGVGQFIFLSSMIVYGPPARAGHTRVIAPDTEPNPENAYGLSKLEAERALNALADERFRVAILRPPTVYGKGCRGNYATLSKWAGKLPVFPDMPGARSVIFVETLAEFIRRIADDRAQGLFYPQDAQYATTTGLMREIASARGLNIAFTRAFNPILRLLGSASFLRRVFGGIAYEQGMSEYPQKYRVANLREAIERTEE